ncbi:MAG TPA: cache domain-containing protein [Spirochaetota bacterium]|nr:cache domain-containing protein [Spirochaetota bacterium]
MFYSTRSRLIIGFLGVSMLVGIISLVIGSGLLYRAVLNEATMRISLDLNSAREIYISRTKTMNVALNIATLDPEFRSLLSEGDTKRLLNKVRNVAQQSELDFAGIVGQDGRTVCRIGPKGIPGGNEPEPNPIADFVLRRGKGVSGTVILSGEFLLQEDPMLAQRARIELLPTPRAAPRAEDEETNGMAIAAAVPIYEGDNLVGILYGGKLLSRDREIVDKVRETVFQEENFKDRSIGTATIFFKDLRISTNVLNPQQQRAIGTRVSEEVRDRVLIEGKRWSDRAFVVSDWYITAYEPIIDITGDRVGILYVGVLEDKYADVRRKLLSVFILITIAGMAVAIGLGYIMAHKITRPVRQLIRASSDVSKGKLTPDIGPISKNEIGFLQTTFSEMLSSLRERDERQRAESEHKLIQSESQASIGKLAAGVAHEINNPLTGVLTFTHMLLKQKDLNEETRKDLETIAKETERVRKIVKGLLDFSRQTELDPEPTDINRLVKNTITLAENQALIKGLSLQFNPGEELPVRTVDRSQLQSVLLNIIMNAFDATVPGDSITVATGIGISSGEHISPRSKAGDGRRDSSAEQTMKGIEISVKDTGSGIPQENLDKLFDPFFTTKEVGQGTGLGLAVSYGIIERHGGTIRVQSEVGKGSTFTVWLPLEDKGEN